MSATGFVNRDGARIPHEDWKRLSEDKDYCVIQKYDNEFVRLEIVWVGKVINIDTTFQDMWKVFRFEVYNYNHLGELIADPVEHGRWFHNREAAMLAYNEFLIKWTASHEDENGKFIEEDNIFKPPPPPNVDAPESNLAEIKGLGDLGSDVW